MTLVVDTLQMWLLIPKGIEALLCLFCAVKIRKISDYIVNRLFSFAFILWALYISIDGFVYTFGGSSPTIFKIAQVLFGIQISIGIAFAYIIVSATRVIKNGEEVAKAYRGKTIEIIGILIIMILMGITMSIKVIDPVSGLTIDPLTLPPVTDFRIVEVVTIYTAIATFIPFAIFFIAIYYLLKVVKQAEDPIVKRKMAILTIGVSFSPLGLLYFVLRAFFFPIYIFATAAIGHIFWILSPLLVLYTQSSKKGPE